MDLIYVQVEKLYNTLFQSSDSLDFSLIAWQFTKIVKSFFFFFSLQHLGMEIWKERIKQ